jgi:hypothetical protein
MMVVVVVNPPLNGQKPQAKNGLLPPAAEARMRYMGRRK